MSSTEIMSNFIVMKSPKYLWPIHVRRAKLANGSFHISQMELPHAGSFLDLELCTAALSVSPYLDVLAPMKGAMQIRRMIWAVA